MALTFSLTTSRELLHKLQRDVDRLDEEVTSDSLFNFVVTGYSLIDWIKNDPSVLDSAKQTHIIQLLYADYWLNICGDLATAAKHFRLTSRTPVTASADSTRGFGVGRFGKGGFGVGEESIEIELNDGSKFQCLELVLGVVTSWSKFFADHKIQ